jgi:predicted pyridoxine 5'-phosphate oxidase superfamily flavin-nucleotide-binding protein
MLTAEMKQVVHEQRLGFVATVNADGTPNVSPKATFIVLDDATIGFGDIRSPGTPRNSNPIPRSR